MSTNKKEESFLILFNSVPYFLDYFNKKNITASWILREIPFTLKVIRKITRWLNLSQLYWYADWKNNLDSFDTIIIFAPLNDLNVITYIKNSNSKTRIIYWYWNPMFRIPQIDNKFLKYLDQWSFDIDDCKKFQMQFNTTFYFKDISLPINNIKYDILFLGANKGRKALLDELQNNFISMGFNTYFHIVPDKSEGLKKQPKNISYDKYLELVSKSKVILDIIPQGQSGLTLRPMESIFFKKKLITTNSLISNQNFYNKQNIFIIGVDHLSTLKEFINSSYHPIDPNILEQYDIINWIKRFN